MDRLLCLNNNAVYNRLLNLVNNLAFHSALKAGRLFSPTLPEHTCHQDRWFNIINFSQHSAPQDTFGQVLV